MVDNVNTKSLKKLAKQFFVGDAESPLNIQGVPISDTRQGEMVSYAQSDAQFALDAYENLPKSPPPRRFAKAGSIKGVQNV